MSHEFDVSS